MALQSSPGPTPGILKYLPVFPSQNPTQKEHIFVCQGTCATVVHMMKVPTIIKVQYKKSLCLFAVLVIRAVVSQ